MEKRIEVVGNYAVIRKMADELTRGVEDPITSGLLVVGITYVIQAVIPTDDFANVGFVAINVEFVATGTTPTVWANSTQVFEITDPEVALVIGKTYEINTLEAGDDFANIGYTAEDTEFVATGTTPTLWRNSTDVFEIVERFKAPTKDTYFKDNETHITVSISNKTIFGKTVNPTQKELIANWKDSDGVALAPDEETWMMTNLSG